MTAGLDGPGALRRGWHPVAYAHELAEALYVFAAQPVAPDRCVGYCLVARTYNLKRTTRPGGTSSA